MSRHWILKSRIRIAFMLFGGTLAACSGSSDTSFMQKSVPAPVQQTVGASGGSVVNSEGTGIEIPAGALRDNVDLSVTAAPDQAPPTASTAVGTPYVLGPSGLKFAMPVSVVFAFDPAKLPAGTSASDIVVFTAADGTTDYLPLPTTVRDATHVAAVTTHFSIFLPVVPPAGFAGTDAGPSCVPLTCLSGGFACGANDDGCGGSIDCGPCQVDAGSADGGAVAVDASVSEDGGLSVDSVDSGATGADSGGGSASSADASAQAFDGGSPAVDSGVVLGSGGSDAGTCVPVLCGYYGPGACGQLADQCGGTLDCGTCTFGGGDGGVLDAGTDAGVCMPLTCGNYIQGCGTYNDGCGGYVTCTAGCLSADGGTDGASFAPDASTCVPQTCPPMACGGYPDGCGGKLQCSGGCVSTGGDASACIPQTCGQLGLTCGTAGDGCGGILQCGLCGGDAGSCVPQTCPPMACGGYPDGCGGTLQCSGGCVSTGGDASACIPQTCGQLGLTCGTAGDGCGGILQCGTCVDDAGAPADASND